MKVAHSNNRTSVVDLKTGEKTTIVKLFVQIGVKAEDESFTKQKFDPIALNNISVPRLMPNGMPK